MISDKKIRFFIISTAVVGISLLYFFIDARATNVFPKCPFYTLTGLFCPGCGSQRAISSLVHLDLSSAARYNLLMVASLPMILYSGYASVMNTFTTVKVEQRLFYSVAFIRCIVVLVMLFWILRNIAIYPFILLAPQG